MKNTPKINLHLPRSLSPARYKSRSKSPSPSSEPVASTTSKGDSNKLQPGVATMASGSATGNPRNKCALQPGHSLMDWIRLGNSGKDLAGTGGRYRPVTPSELAAHNQPDNAWIAIRGKVYNIVAYLDYHPGGPDELMRGAGKDATQLFDQVHAWVNYESLLSKCLIGPLKQSQMSEEEFKKLFGSSQDSPKGSDRVKSELTRKSMENLKNSNQTSDGANLNSVSDSDFTANKSSSESSLNVNESKASNRTSFSNSSVQKASGVSIIVSDEDSKRTPSETSLASKFKYPTLTLTKADSMESDEPSEAIIDGQKKKAAQIQVPKFDWIQKSDTISLIFYTKTLCNPQCSALLSASKRDISVKIAYDFHSFSFEIALEEPTEWPCTISLNHETGKVEINLRKETPKIWKSYGVTNKTDVTEFSINIGENDVACRVVDKWDINHNTSMIVLKCADDEYITFPVGYHSRVFSNFEESVSRSYTPIPPYLVPEFKLENYSPDRICFMVKKYDKGVVSTWLTSRNNGDDVTITRPLGSFSTKILQDVSQMCFIAAGTGLTPMINLLQFSLQRRNPRCTRLDLLFFNRSEKDILWHDQLCVLASKDDRFHLTNVLSDPTISWNGHKGHINQSVLKNHFGRILLEETEAPASSFEECSSPSSKMIKDQYFTENRKICICVCGPSLFTQLTKTLLNGLGCSDDRLYCFIG